MRNNVPKGSLRDLAYERGNQREENYDLQAKISAERQQQEYQSSLNIYAPHENLDITPRRYDNANIVKIIWQLKLRTTLLHNVINQILYKWPEDSASVLDIVERNKQKYENSPPRELTNLIESKSVVYEKVMNNPIFDLPNKPFPSRVKSSRLGGNNIWVKLIVNTCSH